MPVGSVFNQSPAIPNCSCRGALLSDELFRGGGSLKVPAFAGSFQSQSNRSKVSTLIATALVEYSLPLHLGKSLQSRNLYVWVTLQTVLTKMCASCIFFATSACRCALFPTLGAAVFARSFEVNRCQTR